MHPCTDEELAEFYPVKNNFKGTYKQVRPYLYCPNYEQMTIQGGIYSSSFIKPMISFDVPMSECRNETDDIECVTSSDYENKWRNKYIAMYTN